MMFKFFNVSKISSFEVFAFCNIWTLWKILDKMFWIYWLSWRIKFNIHLFIFWIVEKRKEDRENSTRWKQELQNFRRKVEGHIQRFLNEQNTSLRYPPMEKAFRSVMYRNFFLLASFVSYPRQNYWKQTIEQFILDWVQKQSHFSFDFSHSYEVAVKYHCHVYSFGQEGYDCFVTVYHPNSPPSREEIERLESVMHSSFFQSTKKFSCQIWTNFSFFCVIVICLIL